MEYKTNIILILGYVNKLKIIILFGYVLHLLMSSLEFIYKTLRKPLEKKDMLERERRTKNKQ